MNTAVKAAAERVEKGAKDRVPIESGDLYDVIHTERVAQGSYAVVAGGRNAEGDWVFYGHLVENGTTHSAPQPFLIPALEAERENAIALVVAALRGIKV